MGLQALIIECVWKTPFHKSGQNLRTKIGTGEYGDYSVHWKFQIVTPNCLMNNFLVVLKITMVW